MAYIESSVEEDELPRLLFMVFVPLYNSKPLWIHWLVIFVMDFGRDW